MSQPDPTPSADLVPGVTSRIVYVDTTEITEGYPMGPEHWFNFALTSSLDTSDGVIIAETSRKLHLVNGKTEIRLPTYDTDAETPDGTRDWEILVTSSFGYCKKIRVPVGTSRISLASLANVEPLTGLELQYAITQASVTIVEGSKWDASISLNGGILQLTITVPPGGTAWYKGAIGASTDLDAIDSGVYALWAGDIGEQIGLPENLQGIVEVYRWGASGGVQVYRPRTSGTQRIWQRSQLSGGWTAWERVDGAKMDYTGTTLHSGSDLDALPNGFYSVWGGGTAEALGLPRNSLGVLTSFRYGSSGGTQTWTPRLFSENELWVRNKLSGGWNDWYQIGAKQPPPPVRGDGSPTSGYKTVPLALTRGYGGGSTAETEASVRYPLQYAPEITRWRLHVVDGNPRFNLRRDTGINIISLWLMPFNSAGTPTERILLTASGPSKAAGETTDDLVTPWYDEPIGGNIPRYLSMAYRTTAAPIAPVGGAYVNPSFGANGSMSMSGFERRTSAPFDIWIEAETAAGTPVIASLGDSNSVGVGTTLPMHDDYLSVYCRRIGALPVHYGHSGDSMQHWEDPDQEKWNRWRRGGLAPADAVLQMLGSNDMGGTPSLEEMKRRFQVVTDIATEKISPTVHIGLIKPRTNGTSGYQALRLQYNEWLATMPAPAREVHDLSSPVANAADTAMLSQYDSDGTHMNTAGHARLAASIVKPITKAVTGELDETFEWAGEPHASQSIKRVDGREVARNRAVNPSFETSASNGLILGSDMKVTSRTSVANRVSQGNYSTILEWLDDGATAEIQCIVQQETSVLPGQWIAVAVDVTTTTNNVLYAAGILSERSDTAHLQHYYPGEYAPVASNSMTRFVYAMQITDPSATRARVGLRFSGTPGSFSLPTGYGYMDGFNIAVASSSEEAMDQVTSYFDGDTPNRNRVDALEHKVRDLDYDSGLRDVRSLTDTSQGWDLGVATYTAKLERGGRNVGITFTNLMNSADPRPTGWVDVMRLPLGFRPSSDQYGKDFSNSRTRVTTGGYVQIQNPAGALNYFSFNYLTRNFARPGEEPGIPA